jgi:hypothetical protein
MISAFRLCRVATAAPVAISAVPAVIGYWWTATEGGASRAYGRDMYYDGDYVGEIADLKEDGLSVRCVRD